MERFRYDRTGKWMIQHQGSLILYLGRIHDVEEWRTSQAEVVQPRKLPDGLLEVRRRGQKSFYPIIVEIETYPEKRTVEDYNDPALFAVFGGRESMIESPMLDQIIDEEANKRSAKHTADSHRRAILRILDKRFGPVSTELSAALSNITNEARLEELNVSAGSALDLESFRRDLGA
jgi:hypothetical protein